MEGAMMVYHKLEEIAWNNNDDDYAYTIQEDIIELQEDLNELYSQAQKAQDKLYDKYTAHEKQRENDEFNRIVEEGEREYWEMVEIMDNASAEIARLEAELPTLTKQNAIQENKNATRMASSEYSYASARAEELLAMYEQMLEEKRIREEEWAFQALIDAQWDAYDEVWEVYNQFETQQSNAYNKMYRLLDNNGYDYYDPQVQQYEGQINYLQQQMNQYIAVMDAIQEQVNSYYEEQQRKADEAEAARRAQEMADAKKQAEKDLVEAGKLLADATA
jgi:hypothetical protein